MAGLKVNKLCVLVALMAALMLSAVVRAEEGTSKPEPEGEPEGAGNGSAITGIPIPLLSTAGLLAISMKIWNF